MKQIERVATRPAPAERLGDQARLSPWPFGGADRRQQGASAPHGDDADAQQPVGLASHHMGPEAGAEKRNRGHERPCPRRNPRQQVRPEFLRQRDKHAPGEGVQMGEGPVVGRRRAGPDDKGHAHGGRRQHQTAGQMAELAWPEPEN